MSDGGGRRRPEAVGVWVVLREIGDACDCVGEVEGVLDRCRYDDDGRGGWVTDDDGGGGHDRGRPNAPSDGRGGRARPG